MTEAVLLTGKRGTGKSLYAVQTIKRYMSEGRAVATNLDLFLDRLMPASSRAISYRLPDVPNSDLLNHPLFPPGNPDPINEEKNGLLVLDECAGFLNSRDWKDKDRTALIHFLAQSRKYGWDLLLIAQGASMIDKQVRQELCDMHGVCRETSKIGIPFMTGFFKLVFGVKIMMPKFHVVSYYYGFGANAVRSFTDIFRSLDIKHGYNTLQKISGEFGQQGISSNLSAWHLRGRYMSRWQMMKRAVFASLLFGLMFGAGAGYYAHHLVQSRKPGAVLDVPFKADETVFVSGTMKEDSSILLVLTDGRMLRSTDFKIDQSGIVYRAGSAWYREKK